MDKKSIKAQDEVKASFSNYKSYSVDEILAAGGTTAFANKLGKHPQNLVDALKKLPEDAFFTEEEFALAMETLNQSK